MSSTEPRAASIKIFDKGIFFSGFFVPGGNVSVSLGGEGAVHKIVVRKFVFIE